MARWARSSWSFNGDANAGSFRRSPDGVAKRGALDVAPEEQARTRVAMAPGSFPVPFKPRPKARPTMGRKNATEIYVRKTARCFSGRTTAGFLPHVIGRTSGRRSPFCTPCGIQNVIARSLLLAAEVRQFWLETSLYPGWPYKPKGKERQLVL